MPDRGTPPGRGEKSPERQSPRRNEPLPPGRAPEKRSAHAIGAPGETLSEKRENRMKRLLLILLLTSALTAAAQEPLYLVNGKEVDEISSIPPDDMESVEMLPADEETIARYGEKAYNGVMVVTLRYDTPARFPAGESFDAYIASQVKWPEEETAARVVLRYTVTPEGRTVAGDELESTDSRLRRRVLKALEEAPLWEPATKNGTPVASEGVLRIQLPEGKPLPRLPELIWR